MAQYTEWIQQYREGKLSKAEKERFEAELKSNPDLYEEYILNQLIDEVIKTDIEFREITEDPDFEETDRIAKELVDKYLDDKASKSGKPVEPGLSDEEKEAHFEQWWDSQSSESSSQSSVGSSVRSDIQDPSKGGISLSRHRRTIIWISAIAASLALLITLNITLTSKPPETAVLFAEYVEEVTSLEMTEETMPSNVYQDIFKGIEQYESNDYMSAIQTFEDLDPWKDKYPEISLFKGLIHLEIGENQIAVTAFEECAQHKSPYRKYAKWFRNLAYIRLFDTEARVIFILERTELYHKLPVELQHLIHAMNLMSTGHFAEYRQWVNPGASGPLNLKRDDKIAIAVIVVIVISSVSALILDRRRRKRKGKK